MSSGDARPPLPRPPVFQRKDRRCWNFHQLSFAFALRLRLRSRLTLRRLPFRRNPWAFGAPGFHRGCRYSFRDSHSPGLHGPFPDPFAAQGTLPYHSSSEEDKSAASAADLAPGHLRRRNPRPVSCYALPRGMAASKPTSRLSGEPYLVSHLVYSWGP